MTSRSLRNGTRSKQDRTPWTRSSYPWTNSFVAHVLPELAEEARDGGRERVRLAREREMPRIRQHRQSGARDRVDVAAAGLFRLHLARAVNDDDRRVDALERAAMVVPSAHADVHRVHHPAAAGTRLSQAGHGHPLCLGGGSVVAVESAFSATSSASLLAKMPAQSR